MCRLLPCRHGLPPSGVGSAFAFTLSRPAQTSLALRPAGSLNRPRRPLSRGFDPASCPTKSLVSYRINRQLSGWNLPPQVIRAFGAHTRMPPSDDNRPPSNLATTVLPETGDRPGSGSIRSIMAGVVSRKWRGLASTPISYAKSAACATSANLRCIMQAKEPDLMGGLEDGSFGPPR